MSTNAGSRAGDWRAREFSTTSCSGRTKDHDVAEHTGHGHAGRRAVATNDRMPEARSKIDYNYNLMQHRGGGDQRALLQDSGVRRSASGLDLAARRQRLDLVGVLAQVPQHLVHA